MHAGWSANQLRTLPTIVPIHIESAPEIFDEKNVPKVEKSAPIMSANLKDYLNNMDAVQNHIIYLREIQLNAIKILGSAPKRYNRDREQVEAQQLVLYRMTYQAAVVSRKLEATFPALKGDLSSVVAPKSIVLPKPPDFQSLTQFEKRLTNFHRGAGRVIGQAVNQGNAGLAAAMAVAAVGISVIAFQKQVRAMQEAHEQLSTYIKGAIGDLKVLGMAHEELVKISKEVYRQSTEIRELLIWAKEAEKRGRFVATVQLDANEIIKAKNIIKCAMIARIEAGRVV